MCNDNNFNREIVLARQPMYNAPQSTGRVVPFTSGPDPAVPDAHGDTCVLLEVRSDEPPLEIWADERQRAALEPLQNHEVLVTGHFGAKGFVVDDVATHYTGGVIHRPALAGFVTCVHPGGKRFLLAVPDGRSTRTVMIDLIHPEPLALSPFDLPSVVLRENRLRSQLIAEGQLVVVEHGLLHGSGSISCRREWLEIVRHPPCTPNASDDDRDWTMWVDDIPMPNHGLLVGTWDRLPFTDDGYRRTKLTSLHNSGETEVLLDLRQSSDLLDLGYGGPACIEGSLRYDGVFIASGEPRAPKATDERSGLKLGGIARPKPGSFAIEHSLGSEFVVEGLDDTSGVEDGDLVCVELVPVDGGWSSANGRVEPVTGQPWPEHTAA
jgi:hypothetical protein